MAGLLDRHYPRSSLYAVGGNEKAAKLSGINTNRVYFIAYANMASCLPWPVC